MPKLINTYIYLTAFLLCTSWSQAQENNIKTNAVDLFQTPDWLKTSEVLDVTQNIENNLEWSTRKTKAFFHTTPESFFEPYSSVRSPLILAYTKSSNHHIHFGPLVSKENFKLVFGHELAHVIIYQKYGNKIPSWLNEGVCNYVAGDKSFDPKFLLSFKDLGIDVTQLDHPFSATTSVDANFHYQASLALVVLLEEKCTSFRELLNLSLKGSMEDHIKTFCQIDNLNDYFWTWIQKRKK